MCLLTELMTKMLKANVKDIQLFISQFCDSVLREVRQPQQHLSDE